MITTRRTAVSERDFETKQNIKIETDFKAETPSFVAIEPVRVEKPIISERILPAAEKEDIMPTIKSRRQAVHEDISEVKNEEGEVKVVKVDAKTKAIMMTYMALAAILAMIVMATGIIITNRSVEVARLQSDVNFAYSEMLGQEDTITYLSDANVVSSKANELGMTAANAVEEIELLPLSDATTYDERTNGFDAFCDFISKIIGG